MPFDFSCPDWADRLGRGEPPFADLPLDQARADEAVAVFNNLHLPDVFGQPRLAEAGGDWMRAIVAAIFGSVTVLDEATGAIGRAVREVFCMVPKKNTKTTSGAAIALVFMLLNQRRNADLLIVGVTQKIADTAFEQARGMIEADPEGFLQKRFHIIAQTKTIRCRVTGARLVVKTFDMNVLTGSKPIFCLLDEVHLLGQVPYAADVIRQIRGGMLPFPEALFIQITTQSDHPPAGAFRSELDYARGVRDGQITVHVSLLPVLYEFPVAMQVDEDKPWLDPKFWPMVTPNLGKSITIEALVAGHERARQDGEAETIAWATQHLNIEMGVAMHANQWPGALHWAAAALPGMTLDDLLARSEVCTIGVDWGGSDDLASLVVLGRDAKTKVWLHWSHSWARPTVFERRKTIAAELRRFVALGEMSEMKSGSAQASAAAAICAKVRNAGLLPEEHGVGLDVAGVALLIDALEEVDLTAPQVQAVPQGWKLQQAITTLPLKLEEQQVQHAGQQIMAWAAGNAKMTLKGSNWIVTKEVAGASKIDPLMATFNAAMLMMLNPAAAKAGTYLDSDPMMVLA